MRPRTLVWIALAAAVTAVSACRPKVAPPPPPPVADVVVLMTDPDDGSSGGATVSTPQGSVDLTVAQHATRVIAGQAPSAPAPMTDEEIQRRFGEAMSARPLPPREFILYFEVGGDTLTPESKALVADIVGFVAKRPVPDVSVIGHTDTTGDAQSNVTLGMQRATVIRDLLVQSGVDPSQVDVRSHGEADLLVQTPDNTAEAKNRRVEVTVR